MISVSIIITNYNYSSFLSACIESCLNQKGNIQYEVILVDDGSTDNSLDVAAPYGNKGLRIVSQQNGGIEKASNAGFKLAKGDFVVRVDADDCLHPDYLVNMCEGVVSGAVLLYPNYFVIDGLGHEINEILLPSFRKEEILKRGDFLATGTLYRKDIIEKYGYYNTRTPNCGLENYELVIQMVNDGVSAERINKSLFYYRRHSGNISVIKKEAIINYGKALFHEYGLGVYNVNEYHPYMSKL